MCVSSSPKPKRRVWRRPAQAGRRARAVWGWASWRPPRRVLGCVGARAPGPWGCVRDASGDGGRGGASPLAKKCRSWRGAAGRGPPAHLRRAGRPSHLWHRAASGSPHQPAHNRGLRAGPAEAHRSRRRSRATLLGGACPCVWRATPQPASCRPSSEGAGARARRQQRQGRAVSRARARPAEGPGERQTWPADESDEELPSRGVERQKAERRLRVRLASCVELHNSVGVRQSPLGLGHLAH